MNVPLLILAFAITWHPVTKHVDGSAITRPVSYQVARNDTVIATTTDTLCFVGISADRRNIFKVRAIEAGNPDIGGWSATVSGRKIGSGPDTTFAKSTLWTSDDGLMVLEAGHGTIAWLKTINGLEYISFHTEYDCCPSSKVTLCDLGKYVVKHPSLLDWGKFKTWYNKPSEKLFIY